MNRALLNLLVVLLARLVVLNPPAKGEKGEKGEKGDQGEKGEKGEAGGTFVPRGTLVKTSAQLELPAEPTWTDIPGLEFTAPENGTYIIEAIVTVATVTAGGSYELRVLANGVQVTPKTIGAGSAVTDLIPTSVRVRVALLTGQVVKIQGQRTGACAYTVRNSGGATMTRVE